jgi:hypothetical protein
MYFYTVSGFFSSHFESTPVPAMRRRRASIRSLATPGLASGSRYCAFRHVCGKVEKRVGMPVRGIAFPGLLAQVSLEMQ